MNDKKEPFFKRALDYIGDRGFYLVLFICVAVIGVTAWVLSSSMDKAGKLSEEAMSAKLTSSPQPSASPYKAQDNPIAQPPQFTSAPNAAAGEALPGEAQPAAAASGSGKASEPAGGADEAAAYAEDAGEAQQYAAAVATDFMWPVSGNTSRAYSVEALAYDKTMADWRTHAGIDIYAPLGTKVAAAANGTVESVYADDMFGTTVVISHGGSLKSVYSNLAAEPAVKAGDNVKMGDVIGSVGETALAEIGDVAHLHFQMTYDGYCINPSNYLPGR